MLESESGSSHLLAYGCAPLLLGALLACSAPPGTEPTAGPEASSEPATATEPAADDLTATLVFTAREQSSGVASRLQAVAAVNENVGWASGLDGAVVRTLDGGASWQRLSGPGGAGSETLQFRDIHAFDADTAYLLAAGEGDLSRIYRTDDGGASWRLQFLNLDPRGFLDCFDFWDRERGLAYGDSIDGELFVLTTGNGATWERIPPTALPAAGEGEGGFAASGTCVEAGADGRAWIATGAGGSARVLATESRGATWAFAESPTVRGTAAGLMSVVFTTERVGVALGGDLEQPEAFTANVAITEDGGATWTAGGRLPFPGAAYGGAWRGGALIAHGPGGIAASADGGRTWTSLGDADTWSVDFGSDDMFWAVGPEGKILRFDRN